MTDQLAGSLWAAGSGSSVQVEVVLTLCAFVPRVCANVLACPPHLRCGQIAMRRIGHGTSTLTERAA